MSLSTIEVELDTHILPLSQENFSYNRCKYPFVKMILLEEFESYTNTYTSNSRQEFEMEFEMYLFPRTWYWGKLIECPQMRVCSPFPPCALGPLPHTSSGRCLPQDRKKSQGVRGGGRGKVEREGLGLDGRVLHGGS